MGKSTGPSRQVVLCHRLDRPAGEAARQELMQQADHGDRCEERHQHPPRQRDAAKRQAGADVGRRHRAVISPGGEHQRHLGDEQDAEEERQALHGGVAAPLEAFVIEAVENHAEQEEGRNHDEPGQHRVQAEIAVQQPGREGPHDDEGRVRQVRDVEHPERDRDAQRHGCVEAAQQHAGQHRVQDGHWIEHPVPNSPIAVHYLGGTVS